MKVGDHSNLLIQIDRGMDRSLVFTWLNSLVDCVFKFGLGALDAINGCRGKNTQTSQKDYWNYLRQKNVTQCAVGAIPVLGYFCISMIRAKENAQGDSLYRDFTSKIKTKAHSDMNKRLASYSPEDQALLWKNKNFALMMVDDKPKNLQHVPVELLYDFGFLVDVLGNERSAKYIVMHGNLGLDADYLAKCLTEAGHVDLANKVCGKGSLETHMLTHGVDGTVPTTSVKALYDIEGRE